MGGRIETVFTNAVVNDLVRGKAGAERESRKGKKMQLITSSRHQGT